MLVEALAAALVGTLAVFLVLRPIFSPPSAAPRAEEPPDPEETPKGVALTALKEIEFDRETGKLSDADYELLKRKYTAAALEALREEERAEAGAALDVEALIASRVAALRTAAPGAAACLTCGPRPEPDAVFCSSCGQRLQPGACSQCGATLPPESRFCGACGTRVAA
jgi:hypothetical protein